MDAMLIFRGQVGGNSDASRVGKFDGITTPAKKQTLQKNENSSKLEQQRHQINRETQALFFCSMHEILLDFQA